MPRPGTDIEITEPYVARGAILDTGQGFFLGLTERGSTEHAIETHSLRDYERQCGLFAGGPVLHKSVRGFFGERGATLYVVRLVGPAAKTATGTVGLVEAEATSPGVWGNALAVAIEADTSLLAGAAQLLADRRAGAHKSPPAHRRRARDTGDAPTQEMPAVRADNGEGEDPGEDETPAPHVGLRVVVRQAAKVVERSVLVTTAADAVAWSARSDYIRLTTDEPDKALVAVASKTLTGGASDLEIDGDIVGGALELFGSDLGPGQVAYPGEPDPDIAELIFAHCDRTKRCPLRDLPDTDEPTLLAAETIAMYGKTGVRKAANLAPPIIYGGPDGPLTIPYSACQAGVIAREDRVSGNPNQPAAGVNGVIRGALGLAHDYTDDAREQLNEMGVTLAKAILGDVRTYGARTAAGPDDDNWLWFGGSRVIMAIAHEADAKAEFYVHKQIDGRGQRFAELEKDLIGVCMHYYDLDALFGETPADAFYVDTRTPNTTDTIKKGEIHATIGLKTSPSAEWILIQVAKYPIDATLAAAA